MSRYEGNKHVTINARPIISALLHDEDFRKHFYDVSVKDYGNDEFALSKAQERLTVDYLRIHGFNTRFTKDLDRDGSHHIDSVYGDFDVLKNCVLYHIDLKATLEDEYAYACIQKTSVENFIGWYLLTNKNFDSVLFFHSDIARHMINEFHVSYTTDKKTGEKFIASKSLLGQADYYIEKGYMLKMEA